MASFALPNQQLPPKAKLYSVDFGGVQQLVAMCRRRVFLAFSSFVAIQGNRFSFSMCSARIRGFQVVKTCNAFNNTPRLHFSDYEISYYTNLVECWNFRAN